MSDLKNYRILRGLGEGAFGKVKLAQHNVTGRRVAIKLIDIEKAKNENLYHNIRREAKILRSFNHPNIVKLYQSSRYDIVISEKYFYLILEYVPGGELYNIIEREGRLDENRACILFQKMTEAVHYFHSRKISHRDLKLENILIDERFNPKISDFGLSNYMKDGEFLKTCCGSANYAAPEVISNSKYCGSEVDVWSLGVILYTIVCGSLPFDEPTLPSLYDKIKNGVYRVPYHVSSALCSLLSQCFVVDPLNRITLPEMMNHPWLGRMQLLSYPKMKKFKKVGIDDGIFYSLLNSQQFSGLSEEAARLKEKILERKGFDLFTTSYELLYDSKQYNQNAIEIPAKMFPGLFFPFRTCNPPNDWKFGFFAQMSTEEMVEVLFTVLKDCKFEWKIIEKFKIRVRTIGMVTRTRMNENDNRTDLGRDLKFEISLFLSENDIKFDFRKIFGHNLIFLDTFDLIRRRLQNKKLC